MSIIPYEEHTVTYGDDAKSIFYLAAGPRAGPLIIFLHGWPGIAKTWHPQLQAFANLGFRVVAPDMPGYGKSTARNVRTDYSQESVVQGALAVLQDTGREEAIWIGHDWGCATLWTLANTRPDVCRAVAALVVPYGALERGMQGLLSTVDRDVYPVDEYPHGQFSYQAFYEQSFEKAVAFQNKDPHTILRYLFRQPERLPQGAPSPRANVVKEGGWFGGIDSPPPPSTVKDEELIIQLDVFKELVEAMEKTGWGPADSYYMNHNANRDYNVEHSKNGGKLRMPVLFIHARWDDVADSAVNQRAATFMRRNCESLTETIIEGGHHVGKEKAEETNATIARWLVEEVKDWWPGFWSNRFAKQPYNGQALESPIDPDASGAPLVRLVQILAAHTETTALEIVSSITAYADRNAVAHGTLTHLVEENRAADCVKTIESDLLSKAPEACRADVPIIREAIFKTVHKHFKVFTWSERLEIDGGACYPTY